MKKYIFPIGFLLFIIALVMIITHLTQPSKPTEPKIIAGWKHITFDQLGNSYYIDLDSIVNDGETDDELLFHATFQKLYSDKGREEMIKSYGDSGVDISEMESIDHEIDVMHFRDVDGIKFLLSANCKFYNKDGTELPSIEMAVVFDETNELKPIHSHSIGENLYDYAFNRVKKE